MKLTDEQKEVLAKVWPKMGKECLPMFPGASVKQLASAAERLGAKREGRKQPTQRKAKKGEVAMRYSLDDDEPLIVTRGNRRASVACYGFIPAGPAPSVWDYARRTAA